MNHLTLFQLLWAFNYSRLVVGLYIIAQSSSFFLLLWYFLLRRTFEHARQSWSVTISNGIWIRKRFRQFYLFHKNNELLKTAKMWSFCIHIFVTSFVYGSRECEKENGTFFNKKKCWYQLSSQDILTSTLFAFYAILA